MDYCKFYPSSSHKLAKEPNTSHMRLLAWRIRQLVLLFGDFLCGVGGLLAALSIRYGWPMPGGILKQHSSPFAILFIFWFLSFFINGLYNLRNAQNNRTFFTRFFTALGINAAIAAFFFYFVSYFAISPKTVLFFDLIITLLLLLGWRAVFNTIVSIPPLRLGIVGVGKEVEELISDMAKHPQCGYKCMVHLEHSNSELREILKKHAIDTVVIAMDYRRSPEVEKNLFDCISLNIRFFDFVDFYEHYFQKIPLAVIGRAWFLENLDEPGKKIFSVLKRGLDVLGSVLLGCVGIFLFPWIVLALWIDSGCPIFYSQMRVGRLGKAFRIYKFRSMKRDLDETTTTKVGRFLRASHFDEIPQLWNIFIGEMSFVGPRPEQVHLVESLSLKIPFYKERLLIRPGLTGWAQLQNPHAKADDAIEKLQYDLFYVKHRSLLLDMEIVLKTLRILVG